MKIKLFVLSAFVIFAFIGYQWIKEINKPSEEDARNVYFNLCSNEPWVVKWDYAKFMEFRKINASSGEKLGQKTYCIEYEVKFEFLKEGLGAAKGDIKTETGEICFALTENGWEGPDKKIY